MNQATLLHGASCSLFIFVYKYRVDGVRSQMYRVRVADSVAADTADPATDVISYPLKLLWRVHVTIDSFVAAIRLIASELNEIATTTFPSRVVDLCLR